MEETPYLGFPDERDEIIAKMRERLAAIEAQHQLELCVQKTRHENAMGRGYWPKVAMKAILRFAWFLVALAFIVAPPVLYLVRKAPVEGLWFIALGLILGAVLAGVTEDAWT